jgi:hypothetical protein
MRRKTLAAVLRRTTGVAVPGRAAARRHLVLLIALVAMLVVQPMLAHRGTEVADLSNLGFAVVYAYVLVVLFEDPRRRRIAIVLFLPTVASNFAQYAVPDAARSIAAVAFHVAVIGFLGYTVLVVLHDLLHRRRAIGVDDVGGAVCGYILGGLLWGHFFELAYLGWPHAFRVSAEVAPQLEDLYLRHTLFNYVSFTTLTTVGWSGVTPVGPPAYSLMWLEVIFGQFYMAVVVAQLVGMRLAQALEASEPPPDR